MLEDQASQPIFPPALEDEVRLPFILVDNQLVLEELADLIQCKGVPVI